MTSVVVADRDDSMGEDPIDSTPPGTPRTTWHSVTEPISASYPWPRHELGIALPALFRRFRHLKLAVPFESLEFRRFSTVHAVQALPVTTTILELGEQ